MINPNETAPNAAEEKSESASDHCVPLKALQIEGTAPAVGDPVEYTVRGTVASVKGDKAYVKPETINDEPAATAEPAPEKTPDEMAMEEAMKADSAAMG